jgi:hypothetical protein
MLQFAGGVTADQLNPMALEEVAVTVSPDGAEGTVVQGGAEVSALACAEAADVPSASSASTT